MTLRAAHRTSAVLLAAFIGIHVANHLASLGGIPMHLAFMQVARKLYRHPVAEGALLLAFAFQVASGLWFVVRGWRHRQGWVAWLQALSGAVLTLFLVIHVAAVMYGRAVLHLDTNFYFAAAGFQVPPYQLFFGPYYFLAVLAVFTHLGCAAYWRFVPSRPRMRVIVALLPMLAGGAISVLLVLSLAGKLQPFDVPAGYKATYTSHER